KMLYVEVVVRRVKTGSYIKRNPDAVDGSEFESPLVEFFLKTNGKVFDGHVLPCDDPMMVYNSSTEAWDLFHPKTGHLILASAITCAEAQEYYTALQVCAVIALQAFMYLEAAWSNVGGKLWDIKF